MEGHYPAAIQLSRYLNTASKFNGFLSHSAAADVLLESTKCLVPSLPPKFALTTFKLLNPITSACLGLTYEAFYRIHTPVHGKVPLQRPSPGDGISNFLLIDLLCSWKPLGSACCSSINKIGTLERLEGIYCLESRGCNILRMLVARSTQ